jgi:hypothetical protein
VESSIPQPYIGDVGADYSSPAASAFEALHPTPDKDEYSGMIRGKLGGAASPPHAPAIGS